jgi:dephospho-CoA kinase
MLIFGLTGSIGMGKSTLAAHLRTRGIPVFDADAEVHRLYAAEAVPLIERAFPGTTVNGVVDRRALSALLACGPPAFKRLEAIVHPLVRASERAFLQAAKSAGHMIAVLEIPLLFETDADRLCDAVILASAAPEVQRQRVLERPGMTPDKLDMILSRQLPDAEKRRRAHAVVDTGLPLPQTLANLDTLLAELAARTGTAFQTHWA